MSFSAVGKVWDVTGFADYVGGIRSLSWADSVTVHHTGTPDLIQRPQGWKIQHMRNLAHFYGKQLGWSAGPHLFTDEDQIFGLSPLTAPGVHARSFNRSSIGIEMLGNYDREDPDGERGKQVLRTTIHCVATLLKRLGLEADEKTVKFHRDDPRTSKTCPGKKIGKIWFVGEVAKAMEEVKDPVVDAGATSTEPVAMDRGQVLQRVKAIQWQCEAMERDLES